MITLGIDIGSRNSKIVLFDSIKSEIIHFGYASTDISPIVSVRRLLDASFAATNLSIENITARCSTGYGRKLYKEADRVLSEISCHAAGVSHYFPRCKTIIDIGGQDSKIITLDSDGKVVDFAMNDKCAAGTGRFMEMTAIRLECSLDDLSLIAAKSTTGLKLNSTCVVFAESEIIGMMADNVSAMDIARAVHISVARRVLAQISALDYHPPVVFTGGVAQNADLRYCLELLLEQKILCPPEPVITGALGAAILAAAYENR
ncbi:MAG: acyl-CoA dehydratase activase [Candidatus Cloacimonadaceae bacterium]|nr:acyl-CoA dehydratase activase [Candidatus Cloacimonadaceae bacterium]MDP3114655.1 acyl-CoA dehydratase activase [Candidatus Cloacimonadaceae bacterium]